MFETKTILLASVASLGLLAGSADAVPIVPTSYVYSADAASQPQPASFQSGVLTDDNLDKLNDDVISQGGWNDGLHVGFRNDSDNGLGQPQVDFTLGGLYDVSSVTLSTTNDFHGPANESVSISSSTDGVNYSSPVTVPTGTAWAVGAGKLRQLTVDVSSLADANFIRVQYFDTDQWNMLSEIDFDGTLVPEPSSLALLGLGGLAMLRRRRK